jgi:hypothetical protein
VLTPKWHGGTEIYLLTVVDPKFKSNILNRPEKYFNVSAIAVSYFSKTSTAASFFNFAK